MASVSKKCRLDDNVDKQAELEVAFNNYYTISRAKACEYLVVHVKNLNFLLGNSEDLSMGTVYLCDMHGFSARVPIVRNKGANSGEDMRIIIPEGSNFTLSDYNMCPDCKSLENYSRTFMLTSDCKVTLPIPPPSIWCFQIFILFKRLVTQMLQANRVDSECMKRYTKLMEANSFKGGFLSKLRSGKESLVRNMVLATKTLSIRLTITISSILTPQYVSIPKSIYNQIINMCPLVIVNRAPSLKDTCLYVFQLLPHDDEDHTMRMSAYSAAGFHADQDGDEMNLYVLYCDAAEPSFLDRVTIQELMQRSWARGERTDLFNRPRYEFGKRHKEFIHTNDTAFTNPLWRLLRKYHPNSSAKSRSNMMLNLGSVLYRRDLDDFISEISYNLVSTERFVSLLDTIECDGSLQIPVISGAKGSLKHLEIFRKALNHYNFNDFLKDSVDKGFNNNVLSHKRVQVEGTRYFSMLYAYNNIEYNCDAINIGDKVMFTDFWKLFSSSNIYYNNYVVEFFIDELLQSIH